MAPNRPAPDQLVSLSQAAVLFGLSPTYLRTIARNGRLRAIKVGRDWLTTPADVEAYIASRSKRGAYRGDLSS
jgi:excisionase family DNA binding protein